MTDYETHERVDHLQHPRARKHRPVSLNGVMYLGHDDSSGNTTLSIPDELLEALATAWAKDDSSAGPIVEAVRDLFDGQDGELQWLSFLGFRP